MNIITNTPDYITHSIIRLLIISIFLTGCTHLKPVGMNGKTLQDNIRNGELIEEGDRVRVITKDGSSHTLTVTAISEHVLKGELEGTGTRGSWTGSEDGIYTEVPAEPTVIEIPIDDIVLVEEEKISTGKTTLAVGSGAAIVLIAIGVMAVLAVGAAYPTP